MLAKLPCPVFELPSGDKSASDKVLLFVTGKALSGISIMFPRASMAERSKTFCNSRILPGHEYAAIRFVDWLQTPLMVLPSFLTNWPATNRLIEECLIPIL
jgi:hypothetical protein